MLLKSCYSLLDYFELSFQFVLLLDFFNVSVEAIGFTLVCVLLVRMAIGILIKNTKIWGTFCFDSLRISLIVVGFVVELLAL